MSYLSFSLINGFWEADIYLVFFSILVAMATKTTE